MDEDLMYERNQIDYEKLLNRLMLFIDDFYEGCPVKLIFKQFDKLSQDEVRNALFYLKQKGFVYVKNQKYYAKSEHFDYILG